MYFRSETERKVAQELDKRGITFFGSVNGRYSLENSPISKNILNESIELDFLVFYHGKCLILEIDGDHHKKQVERDYSRDRIMLKQGIPTVRFTAKECYEKTADVVTEFMAIFTKG